VNRSHPIGLDVKVFSQEVIEEVDKVTNNPDDREHVSLYIYEHPERYKVVHYPSALTKSDIDHRLTLDTPDDKHLISLIFDKLYPENQNFNLADILSLLEQNPKLALINNHISQKSPHSEGKQC
jgi:spore coat polysaccharide biosynthesis protein SpsF